MKKIIPDFERFHARFRVGSSFSGLIEFRKKKTPSRIQVTMNCGIQQCVCFIYGLLNEYSKKMPTAGLLMEVMFQLTANTCSLLPTHVKREFNQWADELTHPLFSGFEASLQLPVEPLLAELKIFPWILQHLDAQGDLPPADATEPAAPVPALKRRRKT